MDGGNAYARMVSVIRGESVELGPTGETDEAGLGAGPVKMRLGKVTQRKPLKIKVAGIEQPTEALKINERLTRDAKWKMELKAPVEISEEEEKSPEGISGDPAMVQTRVTGPIEGPVDCPAPGCAPKLRELTNGTVTTHDKLEVFQILAKQLEIDLDVGDKVLLLTEDDQVFYIICKVVDAV